MKKWGAIFATAFSACSLPSFSQEGHVCDQGACVAGYVCNAQNICVSASSIKSPKKQLTLTLNAAAVPSETESNVPMLVVLTPERIDYADFNPDGSDIAFTDASGGALPYEIEAWQPAAASSIWVGVPSVAAGTVITMSYGGGKSGSTLPATQVWSNGFVGVWHLDEDAAGADGSALYQDASGNQNIGADGVSASDKTGFVASGQSFATNDSISVANASSLALSNAASVELLAECVANSDGYSRKISLDAPTPLANLQIEVDLSPSTFDYSHAQSDGRDLRFQDGSGKDLSYWIEQWTPGGASIVWVKVPAAGSTSFTMTYGQSGLSAVSDATKVLEFGGLWSTFFNTGLPQSTSIFGPPNEAFMNTLFDSALFTSIYASGSVFTIDCDNLGCDPAATNQFYTALFEGWYLVPTATCVDFGVDGDDSVDLHIDGGPNWTVFDSAHPATASFYGKHAQSEDFTTPAGHVPGTDLNLAVGYHRLAFRFSQGNGGSAYRIGVKACGAAWPANGEANAQAVVVPPTSLAYRTRGNPQPNATVGAEVSLGIGGGLQKGNLSLLCNGTQVVASAGAVTLQANVPSAGWHYYALSYDQTSLNLFVDGALLGSVSDTVSIDTGSGALSLGNQTPLAAGVQSHFDEARLANAPRTSAWFLLQQFSLGDAAWTYGPPSR